MEIMTDVTRKQDADQFRTIDHAEGLVIRDQIGFPNMLAISGGRWGNHGTGITLPVGRGYSVTVDLAGNDTYTIRRVFTRRRRGDLVPTVYIKGELSGVYCEELGATAYEASCFVNVVFGDAIRHDPFND